MFLPYVVWVEVENEMKRWVLGLALICAAGVARAEPEQPVTDWVPDETVVVTGQSAGPAFWHIKKGDAEIFILGTVSPMPKGLAWNKDHVAEVIKGARVVLTAPKASAGFFETSWFLLTHRGLLSMPDDKKLDEILPPDLKRRFDTERSALNMKGSDFDDDPPILAAIRLQDEYTKVHHLVRDEPWDTVKKVARDNRVPMRPIGEYGALGLVKEMLRLPQSGQLLCLSESVDFAHHASQHNSALSEAWAVGDIKGIKAHFVPSQFEGCIKQSAQFGKFVDRAVADYLKEIRLALAKPGKTVMLADIGSLLRQTGVADELRKEGIVIEGPAE